MSVATSRQRPNTAAPVPWWLWPHLLSLEAPAVAVLWTWSLAELAQVRLMPGVLPGLGLVVWLIYVIDRLLDSFGSARAELSPRHRIYQQYRCVWLLGMIPVTLALVIWLGLWVIPSALLGLSLSLLPLIIVYLALHSGNERTRAISVQIAFGLIILLIQFFSLSLPTKLMLTLLLALSLRLVIQYRLHERLARLLRKEVAAGLIFAFGCTQWSRFISLVQGDAGHWSEMLLLTLLFTANLTVITEHEDSQDYHGLKSPATLALSVLFSLGITVVAGLGYLPSTFQLLGVAVAISLLALMGLWRSRHSFSREAFRVLADVAILLPAIFIIILGLVETGSAEFPCCP